MGMVGLVLGVFLMFSAAVAWIGGDREKAHLEDDLQASRKAQTEVSAEADRAKEQSSKQDERMKEIQGRLDESLGEKNKLERALALEERNKSATLGVVSAGAPGDTRAAYPSADESGGPINDASRRPLIEMPPGGKNKPESALSPEEGDKSAANANKTAGGLWETLTAAVSADAGDSGDEDSGGAEDPRLKAAEESLRREAAARAEAEKKLAIETRALAYLETELNETLMENSLGWQGVPFEGAAFCPWDPGKR